MGWFGLGWKHLGRYKSQGKASLQTDITVRIDLSKSAYFSFVLWVYTVIQSGTSSRSYIPSC